MKKGLIHLYWGEGKGKTTASMGLALRALGAGRKVVIVQFLKGADTGEIPLLCQLGATVYRGKAGQKFVSRMTEEEKAATCDLQNQNLRSALEENADLLILDEACAAWQLDMVDRDLLRRAAEEKPEDQELVMTGRNPAEWMKKLADYQTEMHCWAHPYHQGIPARKGVEF